MILSQTAEYAFRAMAALAGLAAGEAITATGLAERTGVPVHYLSKVMRRLVLGKLVRGHKGHGGGFQLARPAATIRFADVLRATDTGPQPNRCAFGWGECDVAHPCPATHWLRCLRLGLVPVHPPIGSCQQPFVGVAIFREDAGAGAHSQCYVAAILGAQRDCGNGCLQLAAPLIGFRTSA